MALARHVIGLDPGQEYTAAVLWDGRKIEDYIYDTNEAIQEWLRGFKDDPAVACACEMVASYGMPVGKTVFETVLWIGRYDETWRSMFGVWTKKVYRIEVKTHFCHNSRAKDTHIRMALCDRFGEPGTKRKPGLTYGLSGDIWSAFAVAVYFVDTRKAAQLPEQPSEPKNVWIVEPTQKPQASS